MTTVIQHMRSGDKLPQLQWDPQQTEDVETALSDFVRCTHRPKGAFALRIATGWMPRVNWYLIFSRFGPEAESPESCWTSKLFLAFTTSELERKAKQWQEEHALPLVRTVRISQPTPFMTHLRKDSSRIVLLSDDVEYLADATLQLALSVRTMAAKKHFDCPHMSSLEDDLKGTPYKIVGALKSSTNVADYDDERYMLIDLTTSRWWKDGDWRESPAVSANSHLTPAASAPSNLDLCSPFGAPPLTRKDRPRLPSVTETPPPSPNTQKKSFSLRDSDNRIPTPTSPKIEKKPSPEPRALFDYTRSAFDPESKKDIIDGAIRAYLAEFPSEERRAQVEDIIAFDESNPRLRLRFFASLLATERGALTARPALVSAISSAYNSASLRDQAIFLIRCFGRLAGYDELPAERYKWAVSFIEKIEENRRLLAGSGQDGLLLHALYTISSALPEYERLGLRAITVADEGRIEAGDNITLNLLYRVAEREAENAKGDPETFLNSGSIQKLLLQLDVIKLEAFILSISRHFNAPIDHILAWLQSFVPLFGLKLQNALRRLAKDGLRSKSLQDFELR